jgi:hypothetical protein
MSTADDRDAEARKARADEIRRARDERNARISSGQPAEPESGNAAESDESGNDEPNYADLIDQRMRQERGEGG